MFVLLRLHLPFTFIRSWTEQDQDDTVFPDEKSTLKYTLFQYAYYTFIMYFKRSVSHTNFELNILKNIL